MASAHPKTEPPPTGEIDITPVDARQAVKTRHIRWVLIISLLLCVAALGGVFLWYVSAQPAAAATAALHLGQVASQQAAGLTSR